MKDAFTILFDATDAGVPVVRVVRQEYADRDITVLESETDADALLTLAASATAAARRAIQRASRSEAVGEKRTRR